MAASEAAEFLIKKGKRQAASYIQSFCHAHNNLDITNEVFDSILNPIIPIDDWDTIDWCRWLLAGGKTPEEYTQTVRKYDNATTCGLVWTANFVAYRCRTCGISPCMSLCSDCFQRGNHEGHDFNMFRSQAGGACDCGDKSVMRESGFCQRHGPQNQLNKPEAPPDLLSVAEVLMPRLFLRLIQHLRDNSEPSFVSDSTLDRYVAVILLADSFLTLLHNHSEMGAAMRNVMTRALINPQLYYQLAVSSDSPVNGPPNYKEESIAKYIDARNSFECSVDEMNFDHGIFSATCCTAYTLKQSSFLDELVFWTIKFEFPQKLVCLLLNMMPDLNYKEAFTKIFVKHYDRISKMLARSSDSDTLSNRVVHVSVQLFSNEDLAYDMTKDYDLLKIMINSLYSMMVKIAQNSILQCPDKNDHKVVDCSHRIMKEHCYWPLVSDLNNVLTHEAVAFKFLEDSSLIKLWFKFLSLFQGMNVNQRELKDHVEFESTTYYAAFAAELEASATPMWALISHLKSAETLDKTQEILTICVEAICNWFDTIGYCFDDPINPFQISFHIPLHRCFASFLGQAVRHQGGVLDSLLPQENVLKMMMMHPLRAQIAFHEILSNMWVRSGLQIKGQAMTYIQCHFCNSIVDADLFLLQICAMKLNPEWFMYTIIRRFHVSEWFTFNLHRTYTFLEYDKVLPMLEGTLYFLTTLLSIHTNIGQTEEEVTRQEMLSLLCMSDRTHSQLLDLLPDKCGATSQNKDFESILKKVADYKAPNFESGGTMVQGTFVPRAKVWEEEYDPIHVFLRAVHRREYQASLDRYAQYLRQSNKITGSRPPWPPYRIPGPVHNAFVDPRRILHCKYMHGIIFTILLRAVNDPDLPEQILSLCIYLLDMAVRFPYTGKDSTEEKEQLDEVEDMKYQEWFDSCDILKNVTKVIGRVVIAEKVMMSMRMVEEMEVDEEIEEDMDDDDMGLDEYEVQSPLVEEDALDSVIQELHLPLSAGLHLALPAASSDGGTSGTSSNDNQLIPASQSSVGDLVSIQQSPSTSASGSSTSHNSATSSQSQDSVSSNSFNMALIPTSKGLCAMKPRSMKLKQVPGRHRMLLSDRGLPLANSLLQCCHSDDSSVPNRPKYMSFSSKKTVAINESILSLLLQLHSKLSEKPDSYQPKAKSDDASQDSRIGDGVLVIERVINIIAWSGEDKMHAIQNIRQRLWPKKNEESGSPSMENVDKEERRRRAKERQQKLMAEFASKQKAFMQKTLETQGTEGASGVDDTLLNEEKEFECVICGQMTASEDDRPVGIVALLQATSVIGHCHQNADRRLPCNEEERIDLTKGKTLADVEENRVEFLQRQFDNRHWPMGINVGWQGGVHVQSCGHYLHIDCHKSYVQSLKSQNQLSSRLQNLAVDKGEYSCPLCRQLANSVIPLNPNYGKSSFHSSGKSLKDVANDLGGLMTLHLSDKYRHICGPGLAYARNSDNQDEGVVHKLQWTLERYRHQFEKFYFNLQDKFSSFFVNNPNDIYPQSFLQGKRESRLLKSYMGAIMEDITNTTFPQYRSLGSPNPSSLFVFVCSISRTNLEVELVQRGGTLQKSFKRKPCLVPLMHVLSMHARLLLPTVPHQAWTRLTGQMQADHYSLALWNVEVPLLIRDCIALLLQIVLTTPMNIDKGYYTCIVQVLFNLLYIKGLTQISYVMKSSERYLWKEMAQKRLKLAMQREEDLCNNVTVLLSYVVSNLEHSWLYVDDDEMCEANPFEGGEDSLEEFMVFYCMHYLRIASLLQSHLYEEDIPETKDGESEFVTLSRFLDLVPASATQVKSSSCIKWVEPDAKTLIDTWCQDFVNFVNKSVVAARALIMRHVQWNLPALLKLPHNYDDIFKYYHKKICAVCHSEPKDPSLCLACGTMVCLRENCCRQSTNYEAVIHSVSCGAGTAMYLAVNSSTIIVIRGKRACLWGSVYLDSFGEEDRDLKRGKPLYLSADRYNLLQQQWINHSFDHTNKRWVWHKDNL